MRKKMTKINKKIKEKNRRNIKKMEKKIIMMMKNNYIFLIVKFNLI